MEASWKELSIYESIIIITKSMAFSLYMRIAAHQLTVHKPTTGRMCDQMDEINESFDVEAQQSLLQAEETQVIEAEQVVDEADEKERISNGRQALQRLILVIRSTNLFLSGANYYSDDVSSSSSTSTNANYTAICSSPHDHDSGIVPELQNSAESAQDTSSTAQSAPQHGKQYSDIELQRVQRENIAEIVKKKNLHDLNNRLGGVRGVAEALISDLCNGISNPQTNICHQNSTQLLSQYLITFYHSFLGACKNLTIFLLFFAAMLSLTFGIKEQGLNINGWFDGAVVILTIFVLVIFATVHNFFEEMRSQRKLENSWQLKEGKMEVLVVRGGDNFFVSVIDLQVGDIVVLRKGDQVPADGVFVDGQTLELDDSTTIKPTITDENNPFLFYGSRVINGNGRMIVTSMGMDTVWGEMMSQAIQSTDKKCTVEAYLHKLNTCIQIVGLSISILIIIVLFLRWKAGKLDDENGYKTDNKGEPTQVNTILDAIKGIITASKGTARVLTTLLSISLLGVMDGLPFVISVAIIIWNRKTLACKASERDYLACVKMASVTAICTDKFGGLTEHEKVIDWFFVGEELVCESSVVASNVLEYICDGIGLLFLLSSSECESKVLPLISWAETKLGMKKGSVRERCKIISSNGCNPYQESCRVLIEKTGNEGQKEYLLHCIGPPQEILSMCSEYYDIKGNAQTIDAQKRRMFDPVTQHILSEAEGVGYACKCVNEYDVATIVDDNFSFTFLGMVGLKDAKMEDTKLAISTLMEGGIRTILTSRDDVTILQTVGQNCGLLSDSDDLVLTGEEFRSWSDEEKMIKLNKIRIIGNCLPSDKIHLIKCLKERGEVVALLGQRTIDAPALRQADIGLTFGTWSSEVARESCDISIWNGDFNFLINVIENGRCFHENIRKFIQLELIITISSSLINFTATLVLGDAPITVIKLFWLNLVVALVGGLALLTGPSTESLMTMLPVRYSSAKLITKAMWRNIAIQASYQTTILVTLQHEGNAILGESRVKSMVYNGFFLCQIFNKFIARMPEEKNIFRGLFQKNRWFLGALVLLLICQAVFAVAENILGDNPGLSWKLWSVCLFIGLICWLLDMAGKTASIFFNFLANFLFTSEN